MASALAASGVQESRIRMIRTFVRAPADGPRLHRARRIAYVGRLAHEKGVHVLVDAFRILADNPRYDDVELHIAGDLSTLYGNLIRGRVESLGRRVSLRGFLSERQVREMLEGSLVSVVPSLWPENTPNAMLESLAAATPVIASNLGSMAEVLHGSGAGVLVPRGDPAALALALARTLENEPGRLDMAAAALAMARRTFAPEVHVSELLDVLSPER
jgi:glycosyltransferase involved in cell wall biosynthesis